MQILVWGGLALVRLESQLATLDGPALMRRCALNLRDGELWAEFHSRYRRRILLFLLRAFRVRGGESDDFVQYADDWVQEVFTKLVQNAGRAILSFRGTTEFSVHAFLGSIAASVVADQLRSKRAQRRSAKIIPIDEVPESTVPNATGDAGFTSLIELIDLERALLTSIETRNHARDLWIIKLHFIDGLNAREIAAMPGLQLTTSGLEKVLERARNKLAKKQRT